MSTTDFRTIPFRGRSASTNTIPHDAYHHHSEDEDEGDDSPHAEARLNAILQEHEAAGLQIMRRLNEAKRKVESYEDELDRHSERGICLRKHAREFYGQGSDSQSSYSQGSDSHYQGTHYEDSHYQGSHHQHSHYPNSHYPNSHYPNSHYLDPHHRGSHHQGSHAPQQAANRAVRRVSQAPEHPPHIEISRRTAKEKRVHFTNTTDAERGYRTLDSISTHVRQHTVEPHDSESQDSPYTAHLIVEPHGAGSHNRVHGSARQCCQCSVVCVKTGAIQWCRNCPHNICHRCVEGRGKWVLKVEVDARGKIGV